MIIFIQIDNKKKTKRKKKYNSKAMVSQSIILNVRIWCILSINFYQQKKFVIISSNEKKIKFSDRFFRNHFFSILDYDIYSWTKIDLFSTN